MKSCGLFTNALSKKSYHFVPAAVLFVYFLGPIQKVNDLFCFVFFVVKKMKESLRLADVANKKSNKKSIIQQIRAKNHSYKKDYTIFIPQFPQREQITLIEKTHSLGVLYLHTYLEKHAAKKSCLKRFPNPVSLINNRLCSYFFTGLKKYAKKDLPH